LRSITIGRASLENLSDAARRIRQFKNELTPENHLQKLPAFWSSSFEAQLIRQCGVRGFRHKFGASIGSHARPHHFGARFLFPGM
jgi:hypothetical protein